MLLSPDNEICDVCGFVFTLREQRERLFGSPNSIFELERKRNGSDILPCSVGRIQCDYHDSTEWRPAWQVFHNSEIATPEAPLLQIPLELLIEIGENLPPSDAGILSVM